MYKSIAISPLLMFLVSFSQSKDARNIEIVESKPQITQSPMVADKPLLILYDPFQPIPAIPKFTQLIVEKPQHEVPEWVLKGILKTETRSYYDDNGKIIYVDKRRGGALDIGPFQMRKIAFDEVAKPGESFWKLEKSPKFAEEIAIRYLTLLNKKYANGDWNKTVMMYNVGPTRYKSLYKTAAKYLAKVKSAINNIDEQT